MPQSQEPRSQVPQLPVNSVFVYGTLKRGQCRQRCWPCLPQRVVAAITRGALYARDDYPALLPGTDWVLGELWSFGEHEMPQVLQVLDEIEECNQPGLANLYTRELTQVFSVDEQPLGEAFTYHYAQSQPSVLRQHGFTPLVGAYVSWPAK